MKEWKIWKDNVIIEHLRHPRSQPLDLWWTTWHRCVFIEQSACLTHCLPSCCCKIVVQIQVDGAMTQKSGHANYLFQWDNVWVFFSPPGVWLWTFRKADQLTAAFQALPSFLCCQSLCGAKERHLFHNKDLQPTTSALCVSLQSLFNAALSVNIDLWALKQFPKPPCSIKKGRAFLRVLWNATRLRAAGVWSQL